LGRPSFLNKWVLVIFSFWSSFECYSFLCWNLFPSKNHLDLGFLGTRRLHRLIPSNSFVSHEEICVLGIKSSDFDSRFLLNLCSDVKAKTWGFDRGFCFGSSHLFCSTNLQKSITKTKLGVWAKKERGRDLGLRKSREIFFFPGYICNFWVLEVL